MSAQRPTVRAVRGPLRIGVERGMVTTLAIAGPLLLLQSAPAFTAERAPGATLVLVSAFLIVLSCVFIPTALLRRGAPDRRWLLLSAGTFLSVVAIERFELRTPLPTAFTPWLVGLSCVALSCFAIALPEFRRASAGSALTIVGLMLAYSDRVPAGHLVVEALGLAALATGLIVGVRSLRHRADAADAAQRTAQRRFDLSRREVALEEERNRTDALLHDSVLTTLLVAAGGHEVGDRVVLMAHHALDVVSTTHGPSVRHGSVQTLERAVAAVEHHFFAMRDLVQVDLAPAHAVELPEKVADTLVAAMLQALTNSIKHAGPRTARVARATPLSGGGVRLTIRDDGVGFAMEQVAPERLGVRVSILERVRLAGGHAEIHSSPGRGTTVVIEWRPAPIGSEPEPRASVHA